MSAVALDNPLFPPRRAWRIMLRLRLALMDRRRYERVVLENIDEIPLVVLPDVFNPKLLRSGAFLVNQLRRHDLLQCGRRVLDLGCGSGAAGIWAAARRGCSVVCTDINPSAIRCTRINALLSQVDLDIRQGDLFAPVENERFDVVLFNPPYFHGIPRNMLDRAWRSPDMAERFAAGLSEHLLPDGSALLVLSSDGDSQPFLQSLGAHGFAQRVVARRDFINEVMTLHHVRAC
jgi:release factor glutamine methyltransferase